MTQIKDILKPLAQLGLPLLGAALPIPGGEAIGAALAAKIGAPSASHDDILATITQSADARQKAIEFQTEHQERLLDMTQKFYLQSFQAEASDRDSARKREMVLKDGTVAKLAWTLIGGFLAVSAAQIAAVFWWPELTAKIPAQGWLLVGNISGYLANEAKQAAAYYFGSSVGSKSKDDTLAEIAKAP